MFQIANPWEEIKLCDYESHMSLSSVLQLQCLNRLMKAQLEAYPVRTAAILGVAGGNGLEHASHDKFDAIYGIDINADYLKEAKNRFPELSGCLNCVRADLTDAAAELPQAELVIADLLVEYIGYDLFCRAVLKMQPKYVSCGIQVNEGGGDWVSESPYFHIFDRLGEVYHLVSERGLCSAMEQAGYRQTLCRSEKLPNGKSLMRLDFRR